MFKGGVPSLCCRGWRFANVWFLGVPNISSYLCSDWVSWSPGSLAGLQRVAELIEKWRCGPVEVSIEVVGKCPQRTMERTEVLQRVDCVEGSVEEYYGLRADRGSGRESACKFRSFV